MSKLYTIKEASEMLKLSDSRIRHHIDQGNLKAVKVFGSIRIEQKELDRVIKPVEKKGVK